MKTRRGLGTLVLLALLSGQVLGCASPAASPSVNTTAASTTAAATRAGATSVKVTLKEWAVETDVASAPAGKVTFAVTNEGPADTHEFVVIKTDLSLIALPTDATGAVDEGGGGMVVKDEIEEVEVGTNETLEVTLEPGAYVLICNIYDETEQEAHYKEGMRTSFTVS